MIRTINICTVTGINIGTPGTVTVNALKFEH